jgi:hypothetical protein
MKVFLAHIAALIVLLGDFGSLHHFLVVKHKLCDIHGDFEHVITGAADLGSETLPVSSDQDHHQDSICHHKHLQIKQSNVAGIDVWFQLFSSWEQLIAPERRVVYTSVAILHMAPKSSPPPFLV